MMPAVICRISSRWTLKLVFAELVNRPSTMPEMVAIRAQPSRTASLALVSRWWSGSVRRSSAPSSTPATKMAKTVSEVVSGVIADQIAGGAAYPMAGRSGHCVCSAAAGLDVRRLLHVDQRQRVLRILEIGPQIVRGATGRALDAGKLNDRLVEFHQHRIGKRQDPAIVLAGVLAR